MNRSMLLVLLSALFLLSCSTPDVPEDNVLTETEIAEGWQLLFDGTTASGWRGFNQDSLPDGWIVDNGMLTSLGKGDEIGGDIVYAAQEFDNFELSLEWMLAAEGNSGIFYHVREGDEYTAIYETGPEYQVIDDLEFPYPLGAWQSVGADYDMYDPDTNKIVKRAGEWNSSRIIFTPEMVEYYLNGKRTVSFVPWSADWEARKMDGKWKDYPDYGTARSGLIGLQDHGKEIRYKNIKIRKL